MARIDSQGFIGGALVLLASVLLPGCAPEATLLVTVEGDLEVPGDMDALQVLLESGEEVAFEETFALSADAALPQSVLFEPGPRVDDLLQITVRALSGGADGAERAWGEASAQFRAGEQVRVAVLLRSSCQEPCTAPLQCYLDECRPARCGDPEDCDDSRFCNGVEQCLDGFCAAGTAPSCADGVACTVDSCNGERDECDNAPDDAFCETNYGLPACRPGAAGSTMTGGCSAF